MIERTSFADASRPVFGTVIIARPEAWCPARPAARARRAFRLMRMRRRLRPPMPLPLLVAILILPVVLALTLGIALMILVTIPMPDAEAPIYPLMGGALLLAFPLARWIAGRMVPARAQTPQHAPTRPVLVVRR